MIKSLICMSHWYRDMVYNPRQVERIRSISDLLAEPMSEEELLKEDDLLKKVEVIFAGWGGPRLDQDFIRRAPNLRLYLHAAGSPNSILGSGWEDTEIMVSSTVGCNSWSVAEYSLAFILMGLKRALPLANWVRDNCSFPHLYDRESPGNYQTVVGVVSLGNTGRQLVRFLQNHQHRLIAYDPYCDPKWSAEMNVEMVELEEIFQNADAVTLHAPLTEETTGMITGSHIRMMKRNATFLNTARGKILDEESVLQALEERPDIFAVLDVATVEPPPADSALYRLPNVMLTPHIAGSVFDECLRMSDTMIAELERHLRGESILYAVSKNTRCSLP